ncbi:MAG: GNAT family N-acetyltransferase [Armatimonadota bacterium]
MSGFTIDNVRTEHIDGVIDLLRSQLPAEGISPTVFREKVLFDPNFHADGAFIAVTDGRVVGFMFGVVRRCPLEDAAPDADRGWITLMAVDAAHQRQGIGGELLRCTIDFFRGQGVRSVWVSPYAPNYFTPGVDESAYPGAIEFLRKHGFQTAYRPLSMESDLRQSVVPEWVQEKADRLTEDGVRMEPFKPEHIIPLTDFLRDEFPGDWQRLLRESMLRIARGESEPDHIFTAMDGDRCLGFCRHEGERFGPFGVARSERGRGIGAVLLFKCLQSMRSKEMERAWFMWTDDNTAKLYSQAGFRETRRFSVMMREI